MSMTGEEKRTSLQIAAILELHSTTVHNAQLFQIQILLILTNTFSNSTADYKYKYKYRGNK